MQYLQNNISFEILISLGEHASGGARTHNLWLRRPTLYPVELRTQQVGKIGANGSKFKVGCSKSRVGFKGFANWELGSRNPEPSSGGNKLAYLADDPKVGRDNLQNPV
jgi:hypothetical protein